MRYSRHTGLVALLWFASATFGWADDAAKQPAELGAVPWERDFDKAIAAARKAQKPLLVLFQEVPG